MKKIVLLILSISLAFGLIACTEEPETTNWVVLPDLVGQTEDEIKASLDTLGVTYEIVYHDEQVRVYELEFIMYINYSVGDIVSDEDVIEVLIYPEYVPNTIITLPNFTQYREDDVIKVMIEQNIIYYTDYVITHDESLHGMFIGYVGGYEAGDEFDNISAIGIQIYKYQVEVTGEYFQPVDLEYDGPLLDITLIGEEYMDPRGGAFDVTLLSCTDGDTARFTYPSDIYDAITSGAKSVRFLNMDTEETFHGGEEEWGKPASVYTCEMLSSADSIVLQTDPGDGLTDTHGRLLAWIWVQMPGDSGYQLLNYMIVRQGLARVQYEFGAGETLMSGEHTLNEWMHIAEELAQDESLGQWGPLLDYYWNYEDDEPYYERWN